MFLSISIWAVRMKSQKSTTRTPRKFFKCSATIWRSGPARWSNCENFAMCGPIPSSLMPPFCAQWWLQKKPSENRDLQKSRVLFLQSRASNPKWIRWLRTGNFESSPCFEGVAYLLKAQRRWMFKKYIYLNSSFNSQQVKKLTSLFSKRLCCLVEAVFTYICRSPLQSPTFQWTLAQGSWSKSVLKGRAKRMTPQVAPQLPWFIAVTNGNIWCLKKL